MEELNLTNFLTPESLKTFATQVLAVVIVTQFFKEIHSKFFAGYLRYIAAAVALWMQFATMVLNGTILTFTLIVLNGLIVSLVAMKGVEMVKGKTEG